MGSNIARQRLSADGEHRKRCWTWGTERDL